MILLLQNGHLSLNDIRCSDRNGTPIPVDKSVGGFSIDYEITGDNLPNIKVGKLMVSFVK